MSINAETVDDSKLIDATLTSLQQAATLFGEVKQHVPAEIQERIDKWAIAALPPLLNWMAAKIESMA